MKVRPDQTEMPWAVCRFTLNTMPAVVFILAADGSLWFANDKAKAVLRYPGEVLTGMTLSALCPDLEQASWKDNWRVLSAKGTHRFTLPLQARSGKRIAVEFDAHYFVSNAGAQALLLGRPGTEFEHSDQPGVQECQIAAFMDKLPACIARFDLDARYISVNALFERTFKLQQADLVGKRPAQIWPGPSSQTLQASLGGVLRSGRASECDVYVSDCGADSAAARQHRVQILPEYAAEGTLKGVLCIGRDITDDTERERRLPTVVENFPDMIARVDKNLRYIYVNQSIVRNFRVPASCFLGHKVTDISLFDETVKRTLRDSVRNAFIQGVANECESVWQLPSGTRYFEIRQIPEFGADGSVVSVLSIARDITGHRHAEQNLALLDFTLNNVREAAYVIDEHARFFYVNAEACRMLGYDRAELLALGVPDIDPDFNLARYRASWSDAEPLTPKIIEARQIGKDGRLIPVEIYCNSFHHDGRSFRLALCRDVTERKRIEETLQETAADLTEAQRAAKLGSWRFDFDSQSLHWSAELYHLFALEPLPADSLYERYLQRVHPEDRLRVATSTGAARTRGAAYAIEYRIVGTDETIKTIREAGFAKTDGNGKLTGLFGTAQDISERRAAEQNRLNEALAQRNLLVREVHHRIKNHLQGLIGLLGSFESKYPEVAHAFQEAASRVLVIATMHGLQAQTGAEHLPLVAVVQSIVAAMQRLTEVRIVLHESETLGQATVTEPSAVPTALIINELVLNAVKHGQFGAGHSEIAVYLDRDQDGFSIHVSNPGRLRCDFTVARPPGTGLELAALLLPKPGATLTIEPQGEFVVASLRLAPPVLLPADESS